MHSLQGFAHLKNLPSDHVWCSRNFSQQINPRSTLKIDESIIDIEKTNTKSWYESLLLQTKIKIKRQTSWELDLQLEQNNEGEWQERYAGPYTVSRETKMHSFAFKLAHRLIPCGHYLQTIRIRESEECPECSERDPITHFLYECGQVQLFWQKVTKWFDDFTHISLQGITTAQFMFGISRQCHNWKIINWILLVTKLFIQRQKLFQKNELHLIHFLSYIKEKLF